MASPAPRQVPGAAGMVWFDTRDFEDFTRECRSLPIELKALLRAAMAEAGELVAKKAKENASYSTGKSGHGAVPASIRSWPGVDHFRVTAGGGRYTSAAALENHGEGNPRHPLFGDVTQWYYNDANGKQTPAYLQPALNDSVDEIFQIVESAVSEGLETLGS